MTDIEALRARMRETAESGFDYLEVPASDCLALDAEITRLREELRKSAMYYLAVEGQAMMAHDRAEAAEAALAKMDEEVARLGRALFDLECAASSMLVGIGVHNDRHAVRTGSRIEGPVIDALARATRAAGIALKEPEALTKEPTNAE